jgi:hypothetical protein
MTDQQLIKEWNETIPGWNQQLFDIILECKSKANNDLKETIKILFEDRERLVNFTQIYGDAWTANRYEYVEKETRYNYDKFGGEPFTTDDFYWPRCEKDDLKNGCHTKHVRTPHSDTYKIKEDMNPDELEEKKDIDKNMDNTILMTFVAQITDPTGILGTMQIFTHPKNSHDAYIRTIYYDREYKEYEHKNGEEPEKLLDGVWKILDWKQERQMKPQWNISNNIKGYIIKAFSDVDITDVFTSRSCDCYSEYFRMVDEAISDFHNTYKCQFGGYALHMGHNYFGNLFKLGPAPYICDDDFDKVVTEFEKLSYEGFQWDRNPADMIFMTKAWYHSRRI